MKAYRSNTGTGDPISGRSILKTLGLWIALAVVVTIASWYLAKAFEPAAWKTAQVRAVLLVAEVYALLPVAVLLIYGGLNGLRVRVKLRYTGLKDIGLGIAMFVGLAVVLLLLYMGMGAISGSLWHPGKELISKATDMSRLPTADAVTWALILVRVFLLAGLAEELLFRGLLFGWLRKKYTAVPTIAIVTLLFTIEHIYPIAFPAAIVFSVGLGWLRERTGSILPGLIVHILTDSSMLLVAWMLVRR